MRFSPVDREALTRALKMARAESTSERDRFTRMEREQGWLHAAQTASYHCQIAALRPRPWQPVPSEERVQVGDEDGEFGAVSGRRAAGELLRRLLEARLSRYEPDPVNALAQAESARHDERVVDGKRDRAQPPSSQPEPR
jgi:hypothetical protein